MLFTSFKKILELAFSVERVKIVDYYIGVEAAIRKIRYLNKRHMQQSPNVG